MKRLAAISLILFLGLVTQAFAQRVTLTSVVPIGSPLSTSFFGATTSAQLAAVLSDEAGTAGSVVYSVGPTITGGFTVSGTGAVNLTATGNDINTTTTGAGRTSLIHITGDQAYFQGWSPLAGGASSDNASVRLGTNASFYGRIIYDNSVATILSIDNAFDNAGAVIQFRVRTLGAAVTPLSLTGPLVTMNVPPKFAGPNSTAVVAGAIGTTCPAVTCTGAYTWVTANSADGSTVYFPVWK